MIDRISDGKIKRVLLSILVIIGMSIVGYVLLACVYALPVSEWAEDALIKSEDYFAREGNGLFVSDRAIGELDGSTDATMIMTAAFPTTESPWIESLVCKNPIADDFGGQANKAANIFSADNGNYLSQDEGQSYSRYWHGYLLFLKPLLLFMNYGQIRTLLSFLQMGLFTWLIVLLYSKNRKMILPVFIAWISVNPITTMMSLQYNTMFVITFVAMIFLVKRFNEWDFDSFKWSLFFLVVGCLTSYFDFLTYPLVSFGFPIILLISLFDDYSLKQKIVGLLKNGIYWLAGYGIMWFNKWALASLITNENVIKDAAKAVLFRTSSSYDDVSFSVRNVINVQINEFLQIPVVILLGVLGIYFLAILIKRHFAGWVKLVPFFVVGLIPFIWYAVLTNHSYIHPYLACRELAISTFAIASAIVVYLDFDFSVILTRVKKTTWTSMLKKTDISVLMLALTYTFGWLFVLNHNSIENSTNTVCIFMLLASICLILCCYFLTKAKRVSLIKEVFVVSSIGFCVILLAFMRDFDGFKKGVRSEQIGLIELILGLLLAIGICAWGLIRNKFRMTVNISSIRQYFSSNWTFILILIIVSAIFWLQYGSFPLWDSCHTYWHGELNYVTEIFDFDKMSIASISRMIYVVINVLFSKIFHNVLFGESLLNFAILICGIMAFYGLLKMILSEKSKTMLAVFTMVYAFSPFLLGTSSMNVWDYWTYGLFPMVLYFWYKKKYVYHFTLVFILMFTKETGVIPYAGFCIGSVIWDLVNGQKVSDLIKTKKYRCALFMGISWFLVYMLSTNFVGLLGGFGNGVIGIRTDAASLLDNISGTMEPNENVLQKPISPLLAFAISRFPMFRNWFVLNFNWMLSGGAIAGIVYALIKKNKYLYYIIPLLMSDIIYLIFYFAFDTYKHSRYIDTHIPTVSLLFVISLSFISIEAIQYVSAFVASGLLLISNYLTIDPISRLVYDTYDVGETSIICTDVFDEYFSDSIVYNQQYRYYDKALNMAMKDAVDNGDLICLPYCEHGTYFSSTAGTKEEMEIGYWDDEKKRRVYKSADSVKRFASWAEGRTDVYGSEEYKSYQGVKLEVGDDWRTLTKGKKSIYICNPSYGMDAYKQLYRDGVVLNEEIISYKGWQMYKVQFRY